MVIIKYLNTADKTLCKTSIAVSIRAKKSLGSLGRSCYKEDCMCSRQIEPGSGWSNLDSHISNKSIHSPGESQENLEFGVLDVVQ